MEIAKNFIVGKIANCRSVISRAIRDHSDSIDIDKMRHTIEKLTTALENVKFL